MSNGTRDEPIVLVTPAAFKSWATNATVGQWARYYSGDLAGAREEHDRRAFDMGALAWSLYNTGRFALVQRRPKGAAPGIFDYLICCIKTEYQSRFYEASNGKK